MFAELNNFLDTGAKRYKERILFIDEAGIEEYFMTLHYLLQNLKSDGSACLVSLKQLSTHYNVMMEKLGLDLKKCAESGSFKFVDGVEWLGNALSSDMINLPPLKELYLQIKKSVEELQSKSDVTLIIDDLSVLSTLGYNVSEVASFAQYMKTLVGSTGKLVLAMNSSNLMPLERSRLSSSLAILADFIITIEPLKTGYCKEITGQITIAWKNQLVRPSEKPVKRVAHYKISDKNLVILPVGLSTAVL